ncbi:hypothetical protein Pmar_PMAR011637 [Perkinsus marinus ATCC 50983]|uniref:Uncharacterized protein n=1 Tax=Perkinsus marinus (strain ATCC 50983 / TXsc) TaxID=423536 RepID=C5LCC3_PERM5|nr:hypothetical protein Pmar_PMAR011637 [Perkinsus marinus ATCC 50983]EER05606.1 hypothetical protein Pmar_PMAR011637 [Perkinsus marinus ATCC 50983]|eukprot:XP_002773790.1 hypothetical protein Pmar_PMAR011637 [Perkinsus marinus ATCC 50983]
MCCGSSLPAPLLSHQTFAFLIIADEPNIDYCAAKCVFVQNLSAASGSTPTLPRAEGEGPRAPLVRRDPEEAAQETYDEFIRAELGEAAVRQAA